MIKKLGIANIFLAQNGFSRHRERERMRERERESERENEREREKEREKKEQELSICFKKYILAFSIVKE